MKELIFISSVLLTTMSAQISFKPLETEDNQCTTPYNKPGKCIGLRQCRNVLELLRRPIPQDVIWYIRRSVCKFEGTLPDVCCPDERIVMGQLTASSTTTTPIQSSWTTWSDWSKCTVTCGGGAQRRVRKCRGSGNCDGSQVEERDCNLNECVIVPNWGRWSSWSACSVTCGSGVEYRNRVCEKSALGGNECEGP